MRALERSLSPCCSATSDSSRNSSGWARPLTWPESGTRSQSSIGPLQEVRLGGAVLPGLQASSGGGPEGGRQLVRGVPVEGRLCSAEVVGCARDRLRRTAFERRGVLAGSARARRAAGRRTPPPGATRAGRRPGRRRSGPRWRRPPAAATRRPRRRDAEDVRDRRHIDPGPGGGRHKGIRWAVSERPSTRASRRSASWDGSTRGRCQDLLGEQGVALGAGEHRPDQGRVGRTGGVAGDHCGHAVAVQRLEVDPPDAGA